MRVPARLLIGLMTLVWAIFAQTIPSQADPSQAGSSQANMEAFGVQQPTVHHPAPDFSLTMLDGGTKTLADYRGKIVLLHFWATWCVACRHEMPKIEQLWQNYKQNGLIVLGVNVDRGHVSQVRDFVQQRHLSFPFMLDPDGLVRNRYAVRGLPTTYMIDSSGKIIGRMIGERDWSSALAQSMMRALTQGVQK